MRNAPSDKPRPEPPSDVRREVPDRLSRLEVNPDLGIVLNWRIRYETKLVSIRKAIHIPVTSSEYGAVYR
jgi:hypothetical protein